ncbi:MAG: Hsp33 family molecular chaperone HslO [Magnetovibrio sp.]|nr:Hsp33 family molecular chaperone HslO [Magnetovibrio sp.]
MKNFDLAQTFQLAGIDVRGRLVRIGPALDHVLDAHAYPQAVAEMLAETLVLGATLASALKYDGLFTLQVQSDGPISLLVADVTSSGELRGYARFDEDKVAEAATQDTTQDTTQERAKVPRMLGSGHLAFTVDQGPNMERYQGVVALEGATLAACAQTYFRTSEQLETVIFLGSDVGSKNRTAGALLIQRMPHDNSKDTDDVEDNWHRVVVLLASLKLEELLDDELSTEDLLYRLYHDDGVRTYEPKPLVHKCRCSRKKVETTLKSLPRAEVTDADGTCQVNCELCATDYNFTAVDLDRIYGGSDE